jgi:hypothetical protein
VIDVVDEVRLVGIVNEKKYDLLFNVIDGDNQLILGRQSCTELDLVRRIQENRGDDLSQMYMMA